MTRLTLNLNVLPESQREVWKRLGATPGNFVLYGGTALALRLGHRSRNRARARYRATLRHRKA